MRTELPAVHFPETADIETSSDDYALRFSGEVGSWFLQVQESVTLRMLAPYPGAKILDVGGGHGQLTPALLRHGYQVTVLGSADVCKQRIEAFLAEDRCSFKVGNILDLPFADQAFDIVVSYRLLSHVTQWKQFVAESSRVALKAVIMDYPAVCSFNYIIPLLFQVKKHLEGNTRTFTTFKDVELLKVFKSSGFIPDERYAEFLLPMVLHRILKSPRLSSMMEKICRLSGLTHLLGSPVIIKLIREAG
jgi:ubiquinone/menaquinone biosynthesis C-methylase UbiE